MSSDKQDSRGKNREDADKEMGSSTLEKPDTDIEMGLLDSKKGASSATEVRLHWSRHSVSLSAS